MRLFGRKSGSAPARPALARTMTGWMPDAAWPRSYDRQIRDALNSNPVAQRAIRLVGESVRSLTLVVMRPGRGWGGVRQKSRHLRRALRQCRQFPG